jgi:hypothetical protein
MQIFLHQNKIVNINPLNIYFLVSSNRHEDEIQLICKYFYIKIKYPLNIKFLVSSNRHEDEIH